MISTARVTSNGQITIPEATREALGIREGDIVQFVPAGPGEFRLKRERVRGSGWGFLNDKIPETGKPVTVEEMNESILDYAADEQRRIDEDS